MVRPKKHLGQHFLKDDRIAANIVDALTGHGGYSHILEIGPGTGVLTQFLLKKDETLHAIEMDRESVSFLNRNFPELTDNLIQGDFLRSGLNDITTDNLAIIGNFPYNISSQIFFKVLEERQRVPEVVGMLQKEVAQRMAAPPGSKTYGILSVLLQAYYKVELLFDVPPDVFRPPPKVNSAVLRITRNEVEEISCGYPKLKMVVKMAFNQRRKTLRNALKSLTFGTDPGAEILAKRAEQLGVDDFIFLANCVDHPSEK